MQSKNQVPNFRLMPIFILTVKNTTSGGSFEPPLLFLVSLSEGDFYNAPLLVLFVFLLLNHFFQRIEGVGESADLVDDSVFDGFVAVNN